MFKDPQKRRRKFLSAVVHKAADDTLLSALDGSGGA